ncbi:MAG: Cof-type HAD-IIB family hydrolase [Chlamydiales bacterium]|nr:Cof-type HAD-IIB family hydrolase [Chlamydiales bacterium]
MKGWIALDIDGTITVDKYTVPAPVIRYLHELQSSGWSLAIATGRSFLFASMVLSEFPFPYTLIVQNGSAILQMPDKKILYKKYLPTSSILVVEKAFEGIDGNFLVYSGCEKGDFCYYRPKDLSPKQQAYVHQLQLREKEPPRPIVSFEGLDDTPLIKCFGSAEQMLNLAEKLHQTGLFQVALIRDPFDGEGGRLLLLTDQAASKGTALEEMIRQQGKGQAVIAAGDDENDESMLLKADVKIAMAQAPDSLKKLADWVAGPAEQLGIIPALQWALQYGY